MDQLALLKGPAGKTRQDRRKPSKATPSSNKVSRITKAGKKAGKNAVSGDGWRFYCKSSENMEELDDNSIALTITSPPYWDAIDYDLHADKGDDIWYRQRAYDKCGVTYEQWLSHIGVIFKEVHRVTMDGGFCAVVLGTILKNKKHFPAPFDFTAQMAADGWNFHQDIIWNKVTGGVKRAGSFIQHPRSGYYYPNIMSEYILVFKKGEAVRRDIDPALPIDDLFKRDIANNIWHIAPVPPRTIDHPCPYPDEIVRRLTLLYSQKGDEVLDPFSGSGQTAKVALRHARKVVGYDIEMDYINLSIDRLHDRKERPYQLIPRVEKIEVDHRYIISVGNNI